jgi:SAM-dependent methyltransferase
VSAVPARITWAVGLIDPGPSERLLEVGCGPGVAASLICDRLTTGSMLAVDRSPVAVRRAAARNAAHIAAGRLRVIAATLDALPYVESFDAAFTVDVNVFWTHPAGPELAALAAPVRPGGRVLVLYGASGPTGAERVTGPVTAAMTAAGLTDVRTVVGEAGFGVTGRVR